MSLQVPAPDWQTEDGSVMLYHGDCIDLMDRLQDAVQAVVSDPPYGIRYSPGGGGGGIRRKDGSRYEKRFTGADVVHGDDRDFDPTPILQLDIPTILWGGNHYCSRLPDASRWLIWDKRRGTTTNDFADCEMAWTNCGGVARLRSHLWNGMLKDSERGIPRVHPTQKPIEIMQWCLEFVPDNAVILDPYMGSGTTGVACIRQGRKFMGIEIEKRFFDVACQRINDEWQQRHGQVGMFAQTQSN